MTSAKKQPVEDVGEHRIYHLTHVRNLAGILSSGALHADASEAWGDRPTVDISSTDTREARRATSVAGAGSVASYVPFFLAPNSTVWDGIRSGTEDPRLSAEARDAAASDFILLVSTVKNASTEKTVVTDGDAADTVTRLATTPDAIERILRRLRVDENSRTLLEAEFLVRHAFPFELVSLIGVANDRVRDEVKSTLRSSPYSTKVAVYPPWFERGE